jgi:hypothetical protein
MGTDADGGPLTADAPIAISRVAMLSPTEGWVEGIRVDPRVRGVGVATDLQVAELHWLAANGATVTRYATGERNIGSHRLGARHGFELAAVFRTWSWHDPDAPPGSDDDGSSAWDDEARTEATARRKRALAKLEAAGLVVLRAGGEAWWTLLKQDPTFTAGRGLYEARGWTMRELTADRFMAHVARGEVLAFHSSDTWALAILVGDAQPAEDTIIHLSPMAGASTAALHLASRIRETMDEPIRFRLPEALAATFPPEEAFAADGFPARPWLQHILARESSTNELPPIDPARLALADPPQRVIAPPR